MAEQLEAILTEMESQEQPTGGLLAKAFIALGTLMKGRVADKEPEGDELTDEELANLAAEAGEDGEDKEDENAEGNDDEAAYGKSQTFYDRALAQPALTPVIDGVSVVRDLVKSFSDHMESTVAELAKGQKRILRENVELRKSLAVQTELSKSVSGFFESIGQQQPSRVAPYALLQKSGGSSSTGNTPDPNTVVAKSMAAVQAGKLSSLQSRRLELAARGNAWTPELESLYAQVEIAVGSNGAA